MDFQCKSRRLFFSYRKLRLLYEKALRAKDAQLRARNKSGAAKAIDCGVYEAHFCSYICNGKKTWIILFVENF